MKEEKIIGGREEKRGQKRRKKGRIEGINKRTKELREKVY